MDEQEALKWLRALLNYFVEYVAMRIFDAVRNWIRTRTRNRFKYLFIPKDQRTFLQAADRFTLSRIHGKQPHIAGIGKIDRRQVGEILSAWDEGLNGILLTGEGGSGKTIISCGIAEKLFVQKVPTLFIDCLEIPGSSSLREFIESNIPYSEGFLEKVRKTSERQNFYLIIDQIDSVTSDDLLKEIVTNIRSLVALPGVRVLAVSRTPIPSYQKPLLDLGLPQVICRNLTNEETAELLGCLGILDPSAALLKLGKNLLNLSLIAEIIKSRGALSGISGETELWEKFMRSVAEREGESALYKAFELANTVISGGIRDFSTDIFPGSAIMRLLNRGILAYSTKFRIRFRHENFTYFLCAYDFIHNHDSASELFNKFGEREGRKIIKWVISLLSRHDIHKEAEVISELCRSQNLEFYTKAAVLDVLREDPLPSPEVAQALMEILEKDILAKYFFEELENPEWLPVLNAYGYFLRPPGPQEVEPGSFKYPWWHGGHYLVKYASQYPDIVIYVASNIVTENHSVINTVLEALLEIPPGQAAVPVVHLSSWLQNTSLWLNHAKLVEYILHLLRDNLVVQALAVLKSLFTPKLPASRKTSKDPGYFPTSARGALDDHALEEIWSAVGNAFIQIEPDKLCKTLSVCLKNMIDAEEIYNRETPLDYTPSYWRRAVEEHSQNTGLEKTKDILVNGIRDSLIESFQQDPPVTINLIEEFLESKHSILKRIAIFSLSILAEKTNDLVPQLLMEKRNYDDRYIHHEFYALLNRKFLLLEEFEQSEVIKRLFHGPPVDEKEKNYYQRYYPDKTPGEIEKVMQADKNHWIIRRMWAIRDCLKGSERERYDKLVTEYGEPKHPYFLSWTGEITDVEYVSPITTNEIIAMGDSELIEVLKEYQPGRLDKRPLRSGLAQALQSAVIKKPERFSGLGRSLADPSIDYVFGYHYLVGIRQSFDNELLDIDSILQLCVYLAESEEELPSEALMDRAFMLREAHIETARTIEGLLDAVSFVLDEKHMLLIRDVVDLLLRNQDPNDQTLDEENWDPATKSLNTVRGLAMHALVKIAKRENKRLEEEAKIEGSKYKPLLDLFVKNRLEKHLDKEADGSLAVHAVYGMYTPLLDYLDGEWLESNIKKIFPSEKKLHVFWLGAWDAYVSFNRVYQDVFDLMIPQYQKAVSMLSQSSQEKQIRPERNRRLTEHLCYAFIHGLIDYGSDDGLLSAFYQNAKPSSRGHVARWLSHTFKEIGLTQDNPIWQRMLELYKRRLNEAEQSKNDEDFVEELTGYLRWMDKAPMRFEDLHPLLLINVKYVRESYHAKDVVEYLADQSRQHPILTIKTLGALLEAVSREWWFYNKEQLEEIIKNAQETENIEAIESANYVINLLGERGDFKWKGFLH